jgi:integrase
MHREPCPEHDELGPSSEVAKVRAKKKRGLIADLPTGVAVFKIGDGRYFRVRLNKKFTGGAAMKRDFATLAAAREWLEEQTKSNRALRGMELTVDQLAAAKRAFKRLGETSLDAVVEYYFTQGPGESDIIDLKKAMDEYAQHHRDSGNSEDYVKAQKTSINVLLAGLGNHDLAWYSSTRLDLWLRKIKVERRWSDLNTCNYFRDYNMFFTYCAKREFVAKNPLDNHIFAWLRKLRKKQKEGKIEVYSVEEVEKLLTAALAHPELDLLGWFVVGFYTGIRVDEMPRLNWEAFRWDERIVSVSEYVAAKHGNPRHIEFTDAFESWIRCIENVEKRVGLFFDQTNYRHRIDRLHEYAGVNKKRNGLRHNFASYHFVGNEDAADTRRRMGQKTEQVLFDHYVSLVRKKDATAYWALRPPAEAARISAKVIRDIFGLEGGALLALWNVSGALRLFQRISRVRGTVGEPEFCRWLSAPNPELVGKQPRDLLTTDALERLAALVERTFPAMSVATR